MSTDEQARDGMSLGAQRQSLVAYTRSQGWELADLYVDEGYSGKSLERPAMRRLLADVASARIDVVLVWKLDRLSRRQRDVLHLIEDVFGPADVGLRSVTESFDTTTPAGRAMLGMLTVFAQLEREQIVERVRMGIAQVARQGRHTGRTPWGYTYDQATKALTIEPLAAACVRLVFDLYTQHGMGYDAIARRISEDGWRRPHGKGPWRLDGIRDMLRCATYAGYIEHDGQLHPGQHEPIITAETWAAAEATWRRRREGMAARQTSLLSGLLRCAVCGGRMRQLRVPRPGGKPTSLYYACYNRLGRPSHLATRACDAPYRPAQVVERRVLARIERLALQPALVDRLIDEALGAQDESAPAELAAARERRTVLRRQLDRWYAAFESGDLDLPGLRDHVQALQEEDAALAQRVAAIEDASAARQSRADLASQMRAMVRDAADQIRRAPPDEAWAAVHAVVREAWVNRASQIVRLDLM